MHKRTRTAADGHPGVASSIVALLVAIALAVGAAVALLAVRIATPHDLSSTAQGGTITAESGTYDDRRAVTIRVTQGDDATLRAPVDGTLTAYDCAVGSTVASGTSMLAVDGTPVLSLHTDTPLYRPLSSGVQGADVAALHAELRTLGYDAPDSDTFSWQSVEAFSALAEQVGSVKPTADNGWSVTPQMLMWLPARTVTVAGCPARTGMRVDAATDAVTTAPLLTGAAVIRTSDARSDQPSAGTRTLTVADRTFDITQDTVDMTDRAFLDAVAASSEYAAAMSGTQQSGAAQPAADGTVDVTYQWTLKEPLQVTFVPPAALYDVTSGAGCLSMDGVPTPVDIVASQLGRTMVTSAQPIGSVDVPAATTKACR